MRRGNSARWTVITIGCLGLFSVVGCSDDSGKTSPPISPKSSMTKPAPSAPAPAPVVPELPAEPAIDTRTPEELVGRRMDLLVKIPWAQDIKWIQEDPTRGISCRFKFYTDTKMRCTKTMTAAVSPQIEYTKQFTIKSVSNNFVNYLEHNALVVEVWGTQGTGQPMSISPMPGSAAWDEATMNGIRFSVPRAASVSSASRPWAS